MSIRITFDIPTPAPEESEFEGKVRIQCGGQDVIADTREEAARVVVRKLKAAAAAQVRPLGWTVVED